MKKGRKSKKVEIGNRTIYTLFYQIMKEKSGHGVITTNSNSTLKTSQISEQLKQTPQQAKKPTRYPNTHFTKTWKTKPPAQSKMGPKLLESVFNYKRLITKTIENQKCGENKHLSTIHTRIPGYPKV